MALSDREQQVLRDLEEQLHADDPELARSMSEAEMPANSVEASLQRLSPRHIGAGIALVLVGLAVVIGGVAVGHGIVSILLGVAGFAIAVWGVTLMLTRSEMRTDGAAAASSKGAPSPKAGGAGGNSGSGKPSFMDRQAERWERRRNDGQ